MEFIWDPRKARANRAKHWISFAEVVGVFEDERALTILDDEEGEERYVALGMDAYGRVLVVVYTWSEDAIRIISARKATRSERVRYAQP